MVKLRKDNAVIYAEGDLVTELKLRGYKEVKGEPKKGKGKKQAGNQEPADNKDNADKKGE